MKYFLVIVGFFLAFNPSGLCENDHCCIGSDEPVSQEHNDCNQHSCSDQLMHDTHKESQSSNSSEDSVHNCDFCVISMLLPTFSDLEVSEQIIKPKLSGITDKFSNRLFFSIWNPPNL